MRDVVLDPDIAVMVGNDGRDDGKSQAGAGFFGGEIGFEKFQFVVFGDARAIIVDLDKNVLFVLVE